MSMPDNVIVEKALEIQKHVEALNDLTRELAFEGCRIEIDTSPAMRAVSWDSDLPVLRVDVMRRVVP